ncbi:hypothetical protein DFH08DRAFT_1036386 [Mycena albidolilacea]|uniref:AMP-dependent synthetase/ligase domain-containing protein n=1 Tax=Mycena albidolilacea TaxID=1033008 RepID=A0AAD6ZE69_9AGAR|nr:hypothetical protein DFH08DRAFT_1036386 [Mycena albidolilacea]
MSPLLVLLYITLRGTPRIHCISIAQPESEEITTITHLEFGRATHHVANILRPNREGQDGEVVAIITQPDTVLYHAIVAGLMTADIIIQEVPSLLDAYLNLGAETENCPLQPYPTKVSTTSLGDIALYTRSSGSTGLPRAVSETHQMLKQWIILSPVADVRAEAEHWEPLGAMAVPPFHIFGIWEQLVQPPAGTCVAVYPPAGALPAGALPITPSADNILEHQRLRLMSAYGATEFGAFSSLIPYEDDIKEWAWFHVSPLVKVRWALQGDGTFECQILAWENHTVMVANLDDIKGYVTSDLITSAAMFGCKRPQAKLDVHNVTQLAELRNKIWPIIEEANENAPAFSRIFKEMILIASLDKPLPRAGKGTVQSKAAISTAQMCQGAPRSQAVSFRSKLVKKTQEENRKQKTSCGGNG